MTTGATARHRARERPNTPLSSLTTAVTEHVGSLGRGGVVIAMSSGLVATMGLPAQAITRSAATPQAAPARLPAGPSALAAAVVGSAAVGDVSAPLAAPRTAKIDFESGSVKAVPKEEEAEGADRQLLERLVVSSSSSDSPSAGSAKGSSALAVASRYIGVPYRYGGSTPAGWDCSGATSYIFRQLGISLPRTANAQMGATERISRSSARPGDLVFFLSGGRAYHVGIYAGGNQMYDSGRTGRSFSKRAIWSSSVVFGRI